MQSTARSAWWVGRASVFVFLATAAAGFAADVLFPEPLHLVRRVEDPLSGASIDIDEYCSGNRIITVRGARTAIADYGPGRQLIEIDRDAATYSVTSFSELAAATPRPKLQGESQARRDELIIEAMDARGSKSGRNAEWYAIRSSDRRTPATLEVAVDREITISREAFDALTGSGFPSAPSAQSEATARACRRAPLQAANAMDDRYGLPLEMVTTFDDDDDEKRVTLRSSIVHVDHQVAPPELGAIPPVARLVPSRRVQIAKSLQELDSGFVPPNRP